MSFLHTGDYLYAVENFRHAIDTLAGRMKLDVVVAKGINNKEFYGRISNNDFSKEMRALNITDMHKKLFDFLRFRFLDQNGFHVRWIATDKDMVDFFNMYWE